MERWYGLTESKNEEGERGNAPCLLASDPSQKEENATYEQAFLG